MSGGVRNLRAMFENKEESAAPSLDRGRSPAGSIGGGTNGTSPRPLSKVRTSFVAVEKSGQLGPHWGLRKESSTDTSFATRRASFSIDEETDPTAIADKKQSINSEFSARKNSTTISETTPKSAIETPPIELEKRSGYMNGTRGRENATPAESIPSASPDEKASIEDRHTKVLSGDTKSKAAGSGGAALNSKDGFGENSNGNVMGKLKPSSPTKATAAVALSSRTARPGPISTAPSLVTAKAFTKPTISPPHPKTPTTPGKSSKGATSKPAAPSSTKAQTKTADMKANRPTVSSSAISKPAARPHASVTGASTSENKAPHNFPSTGFHKPKPRSPTRPAKLPASMTAQTASSLSKVATTIPPKRQSLAPTDKTLSRSRSHASLSQKQELHHRLSRLDNNRPALGRPSTSTLKKQPSRQSLSKQILPVEENFLARMMRPTTSSASKTAEKAITPPRATTHTRPTTREGLPGHKLHQGLKSSPPIKKLLAASKEVSIGEPSTIHPVKTEDALESASDVSATDPTSTKKGEVPVLNDLTDRTALAPSHDDEQAQDDLSQDVLGLILDLEEGASETVAADQHMGQLNIHEDTNVSIKASHSVEEETKDEKAVSQKEPHSPAPKAIEEAVKTEEYIILEEHGIVIPIPNPSQNHPTTIVAQQQEGSKSTDMVMID